VSKGATHIGLYTMLALPILYGIYCNEGGSRGYNILRNSVGDEMAGWAAYTQGVWVMNSIDSCT